MGDFGRIDRKSGEFIVEGNVYELQGLKDITEGLQPVLEEGITEYLIESKKGIKRDLGAEIKESVCLLKT